MSTSASSFADLPIHPALARALSERGYDKPTAVQAGVLQPECVGRDLLISSQTGSGKTLAFGMAMAETLLGAGEGPTPRRPRPVALTIVPTRELAVQVREELGWVLAHSGLRIASFTGGTGVVGDLRALQRGVDVVVGTPGRLVDLLRRKQLDLSDVAVVVLDEADEMLDLGFREDLETILQAAPEARRTLLLSATLPSEIRAMARKYQRDAVAVDPRKDAAAAGAPGDPASHGDITYVAHLVAGSDRLAAVVNVLRAFDLQVGSAARAIVFVTTRESVSGLHAALVARGFSTTAIAGDRAQAERDRALEQVRSGEAQVLVATNVAARGLHLPDVDLIVHADLPLNADSLTHRSGRTGRAGRKGTAVLIATPAERRKAERLLSMARVRVAWTPPPSLADINAAARDHLIQALQKEPEAPLPEETDELLRRLEGTLSAHELLRRLAARELARLPGGEPVRAVAMPGPEGSDRGAPRRTPADFSRAGVLFRINLGGKDNADPRWMLPLICRRGGVTRREVGAIRIGPRDTTFEIAGDAAADFALAAAELDPRAVHVRIERAGGGDGGPPRHSRPAHPRAEGHKPAPAHPGAHKPAPPRADAHKPAPPRADAHKPAPPRADAHKPAPPRADAHKAKFHPRPDGHKPVLPRAEAHKPAASRPEAHKPAHPRAEAHKPAAPRPAPPPGPRVHPKRAQRERAHTDRPPVERVQHRERQPGGHTPLRRKPKHKG